MEGKNCPNCGAVFTLDDVKCPYCGTLYYDLSAIDFSNNSPIYLKFRVPYGNKLLDFTQCVMPRLNSIDLNRDTTDCVDTSGNVLMKIYNGTKISINVTFDSISYGKENEMLC